jgi:hypothetical protein
LALPSASPIDVRLRQHVETTYTPIPRDDQEKLIDALLSLTELARDKRHDVRSFLEKVAKTIFRQFAFDEISIGIYDRKENKYRMEVVFGYPPEIAAEYLKLRYDQEDMVSQDRFPFIRIGKLAELDPVEGLPESERKFMNRPYAGSLARGAVEDFHEGDYIDVWIYGPHKNIIGWIELSRPRNGRLPPRKTIRWVEVIASMCSFVIRQKWLQEDAARR